VAAQRLHLRGAAQDCRVRIAMDCAVASPPKRHKAFLDQFLEPLAPWW